jgi:hypothetical protein
MAFRCGCEVVGWGVWGEEGGFGNRANAGIVPVAVVSLPPDPPLLESAPFSSQALLGCGKTLSSKITRHEFLDFCRRSPEIRAWVNFYDDPRNDMDRRDAGGSTGGSIGDLVGFSGMTAADARIPIIKEAGTVGG